MSSFRSPLLDQLSQRLLPLDNQSMHSAAVLVAVTDEAEPRLLLTRRHSELRFHAGEVAFAGGRRDDTDTTDASVALREAWEETALPPDQVRLVGQLEMQTAATGQKVQPVVGVIPAGLPLTPEAGEVDRIFTVALADLMAAPLQRHRIHFRGHPLEMPAYHLEGEIIWGLTGRIIISLLNRLDHFPEWVMFYPDLQLAT